MKRKLYNDHSGFTLIEVILSIAILSIVSVVVLRLFVTSHELNESSRHADLASNAAVNHIEMVRSYNSLDTLLDDLTWVENNGNTFKGIRLYDSDFETAGIGNQKLVLTLEPTESLTGLYQVDVSVLDEEDSLIVDYTTKHYFVQEVVK